MACRHFQWVNDRSQRGLLVCVDCDTHGPVTRCPSRCISSLSRPQHARPTMTRWSSQHEPPGD